MTVANLNAKYHVKNFGLRAARLGSTFPLDSLHTDWCKFVLTNSTGGTLALCIHEGTLISLPLQKWVNVDFHITGISVQ